MSSMLRFHAKITVIERFHAKNTVIEEVKDIDQIPLTELVRNL